MIDNKQYSIQIFVQSGKTREEVLYIIRNLLQDSDKFINIKVS